MSPTATATAPTSGAPTDAAVDRALEVLSALTGLIRTSRSIGRRLAEEGAGASGTPVAVLKALARADGHDRPGDLAAAAGVAPSVVSRVLPKLEEDGLVRRRPDESDARSCRIVLTDEGVAHLARVQRLTAARLAPALDGIPTDDLDRLPRLLAELDRALVRATDPHPATTRHPQHTTTPQDTH
jgi:DNA-binding MarR family transcriptional regulator